MLLAGLLEVGAREAVDRLERARAVAAPRLRGEAVPGLAPPAAAQVGGERREVVRVAPTAPPPESWCQTWLSAPPGPPCCDESLTAASRAPSGHGAQDGVAEDAPQARTRRSCASSTASGPSTAAASTAATVYQTRREPAGTVNGTSSALKEGRSSPQRATGTLTASTTSSAAPLSVRRSRDGQPDAAADQRRQHAAARGGERRGRARAATSVPQPAARRARCGRAREPERAGRRERGIGADRVRIAEHALQARRGLEELAVRALLDGVGDERQRGRAEHPHGGLERAAQEAREHDSRRPRPPRPRASGRRRRRRPAASATSRSRHTRRGPTAASAADVDEHPPRRRDPPAQPAGDGDGGQRAGAEAGRRGERDAAARGAAGPADRDDGGQRQPDGRRPSRPPRRAGTP